MKVSIPYLRVTHPAPVPVIITFIQCFNPLSTGHARECFQGLRYLLKFQYPIYGSRTRKRLTMSNFSEEFQSPIYGSRTLVVNNNWYFDASFNPLSTGHALSCVALVSPPNNGFNPLSTGHALNRVTKWKVKYSVSIPYLRVTHYLPPLSTSYYTSFQSPIYGSRTIPAPRSKSFRR